MKDFSKGLSGIDLPYGSVWVDEPRPFLVTGVENSNLLCQLLSGQYLTAIVRWCPSEDFSKWQLRSFEKF